MRGPQLKLLILLRALLLHTAEGNIQWKTDDHGYVAIVGDHQVTIRKDGKQYTFALCTAKMQVIEEVTGQAADFQDLFEAARGDVMGTNALIDEAIQYLKLLGAESCSTG